MYTNIKDKSPDEPFKECIRMEDFISRKKDDDPRGDEDDRGGTGWGN